MRDAHLRAHEEVSMKRILLAPSFGLLVSACLAEAAEPASPAEATASGPSTPSDRTETSPAAPSVLPPSCISVCQDRYDTCIANALGDSDACLCFNARVRCELSCGVHGILRFC
jgi:hypothetical protein